MANLNEVEIFLSNSKLQQVDRAIASKLNCTLYKDDLTLLSGFIKQEVDSSSLSIEHIQSFINDHSDDVIDFALKFLKNIKPQVLSIGIAITYSIYLIYLKERSDKDLLEYLKKRQIPKPQKLFEQLVATFGQGNVPN